LGPRQRNSSALARLSRTLAGQRTTSAGRPRGQASPVASWAKLIGGTPMATAEPWSRSEVEAIVADYFHMLTQELAGQSYNKTEHRRALAATLNDRSDGSIERKHQNISAILIELRCPSIVGYKPLGNYQALLREVVEDRVRSDTLFDRVALSAAEQPAVVPLSPTFEDALVDAPELETHAGEGLSTYRLNLRGI